MRWSVLFFALISTPGLAQEAAPGGGGSYAPPSGECVPPALRAYSDSLVRANRRLLEQRGVLPALTAPRPTVAPLDWPLRQAPGFSYRACYGISNFVDHNAAFPNQVQDWNCGARTYDQASGYNHAGMDIFLWPFDQNMMTDGQAEIVAATAGVIVAKFDGHPDRSCALNGTTWNAVYVAHPDGSVAWYGHMKNQSLTAKPIGASVAQGEKLGLVGSSGNSTGPHLHFELHDSNGAILDPYTGSCNAGPSGWIAQKPYYESGVNALLTHSAPPVFNTCPAPHTTNISNAFAANDLVYCAAYYHDQLAGQTATYTIYRPDNSVFATWNHAMTAPHYTASYWWWSHRLPVTAPAGTWRLAVSFEGTTVSHDFTVGVVGLAAESAGASFTLAPNPAGQQVVLELTPSRPAAQAVVCNSLGQVVHRQALGAGPTPLDLTDFAPGLYWVAVPGAGGRRLVVTGAR